MGRQLSKITPDLNQARLEADLATYRDLALEKGASQARILAAAEIPVEDGVALKCRVPRCYGYGQSANCPPHSLTPAETRAYLQGYRWAVAFIRHVPTALLLRERSDPERRAAFRSIYDIVGAVESAAFYDGHCLAFGLAAGSCRTSFCGEEKDCQALQGGPCRFPLRARPSLEAVGVNVYRLVAASGWDIFPIGRSATAEAAPQAVLAGLVVVQ